MKKLMKLLLFIFPIILLTGCGLREKLLAPPDEMQVPDDAMIAECTVDDGVFSYVYRNDVIYLYYIDDVLQDETSLSDVQDLIIQNGESTTNFLNATYATGECTINNFEDERE